MLRIPLTEDHEALIDDADAQLVAGFYWRVLKSKNTCYAHAWNGMMHIYMHRLIAGAGPKQHVDHRNRNGLDNRRDNLRVATPSQNHANRLPEQIAGKTSKFKGVFWEKSRSRWAASIHINGKTRSLGRHASEQAAALAYDKAATEAWGKFARLNFPVEEGDGFTTRWFCDIPEKGVQFVVLRDHWTGTNEHPIREIHEIDIA